MVKNTGGRLSSDYSFAYNILMQVIPYLDIPDLVSCSHVCEIWKSIIKQAPIWSKYEMKCCRAHLDNIEKGLEAFLQKIELNDISIHESEQFFRVSYGAEDLVELSLFNVQVELIYELKPAVWDNVETLRIVQGPGSESIPQTLNIYRYAENLSNLSIDANCCVLFKNLNCLKQLKHLYVDIDYSRGFFAPEHKFLENLESFGVGYSKYKYNKGIKSLYNQQLSTLLPHSLKDLRSLKLSYLEDDFLILANVSMHPKLEQLELVIMNAWNHYSFFLALCTNIKKLTVALMWPEERFSSICEIAAQNSILINTVKTLKNTLTDFTWVFGTNYMTESEHELAIENSTFRHSCTIIWENIFNYNPCNMKYVDIKAMYKDLPYTEVSLNGLKEVLSQELSKTKLDVKTDKYRRRCQFCPEESKDSLSMRLLKIIRLDRQRARWIQARFRRQPS